MPKIEVIRNIGKVTLTKVHDGSRVLRKLNEDGVAGRRLVCRGGGSRRRLCIQLNTSL